jgi:peptide/nickel transport system substrate-binding protein
VMLVGGSADLLENSVRTDLVDDVAERQRVRVMSAPSALLTLLLVNNDDEVLRDVRVREAIALAIDRPELIAAKYNGRAVLATGMLPPTMRFHATTVALTTHDAARARALLDDAGLRPDLDGVRVHLVYKTSSDAFRVALAHAIATQLADVGIAVEVRAFEFATFFADIKAGSYQLALMQTSAVDDPDAYYTYFHSSRIPSATDPDVGNRWRYRNATVDRFTEAGRHELDPARRQAIYDDVQRIVDAEVPIVPLWHEHNIVLANTAVDGYTIAPNGRFAGVATTTKQPEAP